MSKKNAYKLLLLLLGMSNCGAMEQLTSLTSPKPTTESSKEVDKKTSLVLTPCDWICYSNTGRVKDFQMAYCSSDLVAGSAGPNKLVWWDLRTNKEYTLEYPNQSFTYCRYPSKPIRLLDVSPEGDFIAWGSNTTLGIINITTKEEQIFKTDSYVLEACFAHDETWLAVSSINKLSIWGKKASTGWYKKIGERILGSNIMVTLLQLNKTRKTIVGHDQLNKKVLLWKIPSDPEWFHYTVKENDSIQHLQFAPHKNKIFLVSQKGSFQICDLLQKKAGFRPENLPIEIPLTHSLHSIKFLGGNRTIAITSSGDKTCYLFLAHDKETKVIQLLETEEAILSRDNEHLAARGNNRIKGNNCIINMYNIKGLY